MKAIFDSTRAIFGVGENEAAIQDANKWLEEKIGDASELGNHSDYRHGGNGKHLFINECSLELAGLVNADDGKGGQVVWDFNDDFVMVPEQKTTIKTAVEIVAEGIAHKQTFAEVIEALEAINAFEESEQEYYGQVQFSPCHSNYSPYYKTLDAAVTTLFTPAAILNNANYELSDIVTGGIEATVNYRENKGYSVAWDTGSDMGASTNLDGVLNVHDWWRYIECENCDEQIHEDEPAYYDGNSRICSTCVAEIND